MKFNVKYFWAFIVLFLIEAIIAIFINDKIIRPYFGDILVMILMYTLFKSFIKKEIGFLPIYLFVFATFVEVIQYFNILGLLGLENNKIFRVILGSTFDIKDIFCYLVGSIILLIYENKGSLIKNNN